MELLIDAIVVGILAFLALCAFVWFLQRPLIFPAGGQVVRTPKTLGWDYEEVRLTAPGGTTHGWFMPVENARATVLFSHGNAGTIDERLELCPTFRELGCNVLLYDYGGYGESTGKASEKRCYADIRAMWRWLTEERGIEGHRVVLYGRSLGSGPTVQLATEVSPAAVVLESAFTSVPAMVKVVFPGVPLSLLIRHRFDNLRKIENLRVPLLLMHSPEDEIIPFDQGQKLFNAAKEPKRFLELSGDHNSGHFMSVDRIRGELGRFFDAFRAE